MEFLPDYLINIGPNKNPNTKTCQKNKCIEEGGEKLGHTKRLQSALASQKLSQYSQSSSLSALNK